MTETFKSIYSKYNNVLKPLVAEQEARQEVFALPLLDNLAEMFDNIAMADGAKSEDEINRFLERSSFMVDTCISQSYQFLIASYLDDIRRFEKQAPETVRYRLDKGEFCGKYEPLRSECRDLISKATDMDEVAALPVYEKVYCNLKKMSDLIFTQTGSLIIASYEKESWMKNIFGKVLAIVISLIVGVVLGLIIR